MMVCGHGDVAEFCARMDMVVCEQYTGDIADYRGSCGVLVTDQDMPEMEYYLLKGKLMGRGVELISSRWIDDPKMIALLRCQVQSRKHQYAARQKFGFRRRGDRVEEIPESMAVARRILELRDAGITLRRIQEDKGVHHPDGRKISVSTIQQIIANRKLYE